MVKVIIGCLLVIGITACSTSGTMLDTMALPKLYAKAHDALKHGDYLAAEKAYQRLITRFPSGRYSEQARLDLAYAQYRNHEPDDAYSTINHFIRTFPAHKHVDYAYYLRGLINFNRTNGVLERWFDSSDAQARHDQAYNLKSFDDFSKLSRRFPHSAYAADAHQRMIYLRSELSQFEINVARFYLRQRAYIASANRAKYVIEHYKRSPQINDALAILCRSYLMLGQKKLASQVRQTLLLNDPHHPYLTDPKWPHASSILGNLIPFHVRH